MTDRQLQSNLTNDDDVSREKKFTHVSSHTNDAMKVLKIFDDNDDDILFSYCLKLFRDQNSEVVNVCWNWKWDDLWDALHFIENDVFVYFRSTENDSDVMMMNETFYDEFVNWERERCENLRKNYIIIIKKYHIMIFLE
jgi:hypothetical protein